MPRSRFDPRQDANAWIPPSVPLTDANKRFYLRALDVTRSFGQGALREPLENSWMLPLINGMTAYWPHKAHTPLIDDAYAVLAPAVAFQRFQHIAWR